MREEASANLITRNAWAKLFALLPIMLMVAASLSGSLSVHAEQSRITDLRIPIQPLSQSLREVAEAFDLQIVFFTNDTNGIDAPLVIGSFSASEVLGALLEDTALEHIHVSNSLVVVRLKISPAETKPGSIHGVSALAAGDGLESSSTVGVIEEVVVTALKRSQPIGDVAASISAISAEILVDKGIDDLNDVQFIIPSFHFGGFLGSQNISIRGIGEFNDQPGVVVSLNGIYQSRATTAQLAPFDLERIEVLRGPQGTLYGRNSNGGAVNFISASPTFEHEGYVKLGYADFDEQKVEGVYSGPISDKTAIRIAANYTDIGEGWIENQSPSGEDLMEGTFSNVRVRLVSELTDSLSLDLVYGRSEIDGRMDHYAWITDNRELIALPGGVPQLADAKITLEPWEQYADSLNYSNREYELYSITVDWNLDFSSLRSITAYQEYDNNREDDRDATNLPIFQTSKVSHTETFSQELNLSGSTVFVDWVVGLFYMEDEFNRRDFFTNDFPVFEFLLPTYFDYTQPYYDTKSAAAFVDMSWNITTRARIGGGVRYTKDKVSEAHTIEFFVRTPDSVRVGERCDQQTDLDWNAMTYRVLAQYDTSANSNIYTSYSEGYKAGGVVQFECTHSYDPEEVTAYEIGYKSSIKDGDVRLNASLFYYDYSDFQVTQIIGPTTSTINAGDAEVLGAELEISSELNEKWAVSAAVTLLDSEYGDLLNTDGLQSDLGVQQLKGNSLNGSPETSVNVAVAYNTPLSIIGSLSLGIDAAYRSRTYFREFNEKEDSQRAYTVVNMNAIWKSNDRLWSARLFAKNLTNEDYVTGLVGSVASGGRLGSYGQPRQVGIEFTRFFQSR